MHAALVIGAVLGALVGAAGAAQTDLVEAPSSAAQCRSVAANLPWQGSGIAVGPGEFVCLAADGLWSHGVQGIQAMTPFYGPEGFSKDDPTNIPELVSRTGALVARIGANAPFVVGRQLCFIPSAPGELMLSMNDVPGTFDNNLGTMYVRIARSPSTLSSAFPKLSELSARACRPR